MHRSGTSALTGLLHLLGCDAPKTLMSPDESNRSGYWESQRIADLNDRILATAGSNWHDWLEFNPGWCRSPKAIEFRDKARQVLHEEFGSSSFFVLKDPRICRLAPFWLEVLQEFGVSTFVISPIRNPLEVAASLEKRDGFDPLLGQLLWLRNVLDAEFFSRGLRRSFTTYDRLLNGPYRLAVDTQEQLCISWPRSVANVAHEIEKFLSERDHRHHTEPLERVIDNPLIPGWLRDTFRILCSWGVEGERPEDRAILDRIRTEFTAAGPAFSRLIAAGQNAAEKVEILEKNVNYLQSNIQKAEAEAARSAEEIRSLRNEVDENNAVYECSLAKLAKQLADTEHQLEQNRCETGKVTAELAAARGQISSMAATQTERDLLEVNLNEHGERVLARIKTELFHLHRDLTVQIEAGAQDFGKLAHDIIDLKAEIAQWRTDAAVLQTSQLELAQLNNRCAELKVAKDALECASIEIRIECDKAKDSLGRAMCDLGNVRLELKHLMEDHEQLKEQLSAARSDRSGIEIELRNILRINKENETKIEKLEMSLNNRFEEIAELSRMLEQYEVMSTKLDKAREKTATQSVTPSELDLPQTLNPFTATPREAHQAAAAADLRPDERRQADDQITNRIYGISASARYLKTYQVFRPRFRTGLKWVRMAVNPKRWSQLNREVALGREMSKLRRAGLFDPRWYLRTYPDVAAAGVDPLRHYAEYGAVEGRMPRGSATKERTPEAAT